MELTYKECIIITAALSQERKEAERFLGMIQPGSNRGFWEDKIRQLDELDAKIMSAALALKPN